MNHFLYFAILCLTFALLNKFSSIYVPDEYWFLMGWVSGVIIAWIYKSSVSSQGQDNP